MTVPILFEVNLLTKVCHPWPELENLTCSVCIIDRRLFFHCVQCQNKHKLRDSLDLVLCFNHNCTQPEQRHFTAFLSLAGQFHEILVAWVVTAEKCIMTFSLNFLYKIKLYRHFSITWNKKENRKCPHQKKIFH